MLKPPGYQARPSQTGQLSDELKSHLSDDPAGLNLILSNVGELLGNRSFEEADKLITSARNEYPDSPDLLVRHAEALAGINNGSLDGKPFEILSKSLDIDKRHKPSLWLMALSNQQVGNHEAALLLFDALKREMGEGSEFTDVVDRSIAVSIAHIGGAAELEKLE